jgi:hypothetical protein
MAFLTESECRKAARDGGYGEPTMGAKQATAGYRVHGLHGMKTPGLAGSYWTKAEAMRAAQQAANEEGESITISTPGKAPWITVQPRGANDANGEEFRSVAQRVVNAENDFIEVLMNLGGISHADAAKAMGTMLRLKVAKLDPGIGRINVKNGAYLDRDVIRRAVTGDALPGGFMTTQTETCDRATRLHAALDCVMDRMMAKATRRAQAKDGEMYKLYSAPLRRHLEVRAPMLEGSSEDINDLKSTNSWKTTPSVITNESGKILESNHIGDAATGASDRATRLHRALDCIMDRMGHATDAGGYELGCGNPSILKKIASTGRKVTSESLPEIKSILRKVSADYPDLTWWAMESGGGQVVAKAADGKAKDAHESVEGVEFTLGNGGVVLWSSDWDKLGEWARAKKNGFSTRSGGSGTYGHTDIIYSGGARDGLTAEDAGFLRSLLEGATGLARAGIGAMSPTNDRAGRLHRALDCVLDRNLARQ